SRAGLGQQRVVRSSVSAPNVIGDGNPAKDTTGTSSSNGSALPEKQGQPTSQPSGGCKSKSSAVRVPPASRTVSQRYLLVIDGYDE
ncbi:unnamed protein product, partial [Amoebophrya sp. A25]